MILRDGRFNKDRTNVRFIRTRANDAELSLHRLLSRKHAHAGDVDSAPTETHSATGEHADTEYGPSYQFASLVYCRSVPGWRWRNLGCEKGFAVNYYRRPAFGDHLFRMEIAATEQPH